MRYPLFFRQKLSLPNHILWVESQSWISSSLQRLVWDFKKSNNGTIKRAIELLNWNFLFSHENVYEKVVIFNQTLKNIVSNYIPNKLITVDDKDPPWINDYIKRKILDKKTACKSFNIKNKNCDTYLKLKTISTKLSEMILKKMTIIVNFQINSMIQRPAQKNTGLF